jgi:hypothetical protein
MIVIAKRFGTYVSMGNIGLSLGKIHCSSRKVPFSLGNLGLSSRKIHCSLDKLYFSPTNFSYSLGNLFGTNTLFLLFMEVTS